MTIGGVELPLVDAKSIDGNQSTAGALRGIAAVSETKFGKYFAIAGSTSSFWMSFEKPTTPSLNWKNRYVCVAK